MIQLKEFQESDIKQLYNWVSNATPEFIMQWAGPSLQYPVTAKQLKHYLANSKNKSHSCIFSKL